MRGFNSNFNLVLVFSALLICGAGQAGPVKEINTADQIELIEQEEAQVNEQVESKQCVMVCDKWGKDCIINPVTGRQRCKRVCKSLGEECWE